MKLVVLRINELYFPLFLKHFLFRNGAKYSGIACVLGLLIDRIEKDQNLTVPIIVGTIKSIRPEVISTFVS